MNQDLFQIYRNELSSCFKTIDIADGDNLYVTGNISKLGRVKISKEEKMQGLHQSLLENISDKGTIFSPAASMNLCNSDILFDVSETPSYQMGPLAEYFRLLPDSIRSFHPFWSICGSGKNAFLLRKVSKHSYGTGSPWTILLDLNTRQINFGLHPSKAVTLIHHIETIIGVPYRYSKEFLHPVLKNGFVQEELFYMSVMYSKADIKKKILLNEHFFDALDGQGKLNEVEHSSGMKIWSFLMKDFYDVVIPFFIDDIYTYLEEPPKKMPYSL
jgi:aminoglycoside 3-N-acetyltransferase